MTGLWLGDEIDFRKNKNKKSEQRSEGASMTA